MFFSWPTDWIYVFCVFLLIIYVGYILLSNLGSLYLCGNHCYSPLIPMVSSLILVLPILVDLLQESAEYNFPKKGGLCRYALYTNCLKDIGDDTLPPVSIIKPLAGADPNLKDNLETFFNLKYPKYEIIFCIQSKNDPSEEVVRELIAAYPHIETHIFTGAEDSVVNPKINNILQGYPSVKYGFLWIVDSSLLTVPTTLLEMVTQMQTVPNCGLVHQMPYWASKPDFASCLNQVYFGTQHARMFLSSIVLRQLCASGASMLLQKAHLEEVGGLRHFGQYLAEDYFLAKALTDKGYKVVLSSLPAIQNPGVTSLSIFCRRLARWTRLRSRMVPIVILEPISECMVVGVLFCVAVYYIMGIWPVWSFMFHLAIWMSFDYILFRRVENGPLLNLKMLFVAWWVRELLSLPIFISGVLSGKVQWKDKEFCLKWGGQVDVKMKGSRPSFNV